MDEKTQEEQARVRQAFKVCRAEVEHEYGVLANRLNSYMTSQAFLVSGYAISMGNMNPAWGNRFSLYFPLLLSLVGILLSIRAQPGITGVCDIISQWHDKQSALFELGLGLEDYDVLRRDTVKSIHDRTLWFAQTSHWIFGVAWFLMALLTIALHNSII